MWWHRRINQLSSFGGMDESAFWQWETVQSSRATELFASAWSVWRVLDRHCSVFVWWSWLLTPLSYFSFSSLPSSRVVPSHSKWCVPACSVELWSEGTIRSKLGSVTGRPDSCFSWLLNKPIISQSLDVYWKFSVNLLFVYVSLHDFNCMEFWMLSLFIPFRH
jgi:hypothetical protein